MLGSGLESGMSDRDHIPTLDYAGPVSKDPSDAPRWFKVIVVAFIALPYILMFLAFCADIIDALIR